MYGIVVSIVHELPQKGFGLLTHSEVRHDTGTGNRTSFDDRIISLVSFQTGEHIFIFLIRDEQNEN